MKTRDLINEFFSQHRFAMVGVSRNQDDFSRRLFRDLLGRGYDVIPVHPVASEIDHKTCYARVQHIDPPVRAALIMVPKNHTADIVKDCADAGTNLIWIYGVSGERDVDATALEVSSAYGIGVIAGFCPYMFLPQTAFFHRLHGTVWKVFGLYPS